MKSCRSQQMCSWLLFEVEKYHGASVHISNGSRDWTGTKGVLKFENRLESVSALPWKWLAGSLWYHQRASWALEWKRSSLTVSIWRMDLLWSQVKFERYLFGQRLKSIRKPVLGTHSERAGVPRRGRKLQRSHSRAVELLVCFTLTSFCSIS